MGRVLRLLVVAALTTAPLSAHAADLALNAGAIEVLVLPGPAHGGLYPYLGVSAAFPVSKVVVIPALSLEWSPESGRGGFVASVVMDWPVAERVGLDVDVAFIHDQPGFSFRESLLYLGGGVGCSVFLGRWTVSPYFNVFSGLNAPGWSLVPGLNVAFAL